MKRLLAYFFVCAFAGAASAQNYPARAVHLINTFPAGGSGDSVLRVVFDKVSAALGQPFVQETRTGAGGSIGTEYVAKSAPDGYTLLMCSPQEVAVNHHVFPKVPYDPRRDLAPITLVTVTPLVIAVNPGVPAKDIAALVALAKAKPGTLGYATPGTASTQHLTGEILQAAAGIKLVHVPYKGAGQSIPDVIGGQVPIGVYGILTISPQAKAGKLRILAVTTPKRSPIAPDVPTMAESGFPGFDTSLWFGLLAPAGTPKDVIAKIHDDTARALKLPDVAERIAAQGGEVIGSTPAQFAAFIAAEDAKYAKIIREAGVRLE